MTIPRFCWAVGLLLVLATPDFVQAGWLTIKNETENTVFLQEIGGTAQKPILGKFVKLQPGETYREFHAVAGEKRIRVYDEKAVQALIPEEKCRWTNQAVQFAIRTAGTQVKLQETAKLPVRK